MGKTRRGLQLEGRAVFCSPSPTGMVFDCLLADPVGGPGEPCSFQLRMPHDDWLARNATHLLKRWAGEGAPVSIAIGARGRGQLEIRSGRTRLVLDINGRDQSP